MPVHNDIQQDIVFLRKIINTAPNLRAWQIKKLELFKLQAYDEYLLSLNNDNNIGGLPEDPIDKQLSLQEILEDYLITSIKEKNVTTTKLSHELLAEMLSLLTFQLLYKSKLANKLNTQLSPEMLKYLLSSSLTNPLVNLHILLASIWLEKKPSFMATDNIICLLKKNHSMPILAHWINAGLKPFTPTNENGLSLSEYLIQGQQLTTIDHILTLLTNKVNHELKTFFHADHYQDVVFINNQLNLLNNSKHIYSSKLHAAIEQLYSNKTRKIIEKFKNKTTNKLNLWLLDKFNVLLTTRENASLNRMLELALFINPNHHYLAYTAIIHGANPLAKIISIGANDCVSFLDILCGYGRTSEMAKIFSYYTTLYTAAFEAPLQHKHSWNQLAFDLTTFIQQNYEYTPNNTEDLLITLLKYLAVNEPQACSRLANLDISFLYAALLDHTHAPEFKCADNKNFRDLLLFMLQQHSQHTLKEKIIANLIAAPQQLDHPQQEGIILLTQYPLHLKELNQDTAPSTLILAHGARSSTKYGI